MPEFTPEEQYLIQYLRSPGTSKSLFSQMIAYIAGAITLAAFGIYHSDVAIISAAVVLLVGLRIYEGVIQSKWLPVWRSLISKFESALEDHTGAVESSLAEPEEK